MKRLIPIHVESHSGYKVDEYPKCFYREGKRFDILEITDRWYQTDRDPESPAADYFKVITADDGEFLIKHEITTDQWYLQYY